MVPGTELEHLAQSALTSLLMKDDALSDMIKRLLDETPLASGASLTHLLETLAVCTEPIYNPSEENCWFVFEHVPVPLVAGIIESATSDTDALIAACHLLGNFAINHKWRQHVLLKGVLPLLANCYQVWAELSTSFPY